MGRLPRKRDKLAAQKAFAAAIKGGANAAALIAGAKRYAAERAGQEDRFTKHPSTWLHAGCWQDEAPPGEGPPIIDNVTGEPVVVAVQRPQNLTPWQRVLREYLDDIGEEAARGKIN